MSNTLRIVFTGSRQFEDKDTANQLLEQVGEWVTKRFQVLGTAIDLEIAHGGARGFDRLVQEYFLAAGATEPMLRVWPPDYEKYPPKFAPIKRNRDMVNWAAEGEAGLLVAMLPARCVQITKGGTATTIKYALENTDLEVMVFRC